jgi:hypothetical protein
MPAEIPKTPNAVPTKPNPTAQAQDARLFWTAFALLGLLSLVPVWGVPFPPMVDLPQHAAQAYTFLHIDSYKGLYEINWQTPYLGFLLLSSSLSKLLGVLTGIKTAISLIIIALPLSLTYYLRVTGSSRWLALAGFPLSYGFACHWGFATYMLSVPVGILVVSSALQQTKNPTLKNQIQVGLLSLLLFFTHPITFGACMLIAGALCLNSLYEEHLYSPLLKAYDAFTKLCSPYLPALLLTLVWLSLKPKEGDFPTVWSPHVQACWDGEGGTLIALILDTPSRLASFFKWALSGDYPASSNPSTPGWTAIALLSGCLPFMAINQTTRRQLIPLTTALLLYMASPDEHAGIDNLMRRQPTFVACLFLGAFPALCLTNTYLRLGRNLLLTALCALALKLPTQEFLSYRQTTKDLLNLIQRIPPHRTVVKLLNARENWPTFHIISWYQALKGGQVLKEFSWMHHMPVRRVQGRVAKMWDQKDVWMYHPVSYYIYLSPLIGEPPPETGPFRGHHSELEDLEKLRKSPVILEELDHSGEWTLAQEKREQTLPNPPNPINSLLKKELDSLKRKKDNRPEDRKTPKIHEKKTAQKTKKNE